MSCLKPTALGPWQFHGVKRGASEEGLLVIDSAKLACQPQVLGICLLKVWLRGLMRKKHVFFLLVLEGYRTWLEVYFMFECGTLSKWIVIFRPVRGSLVSRLQSRGKSCRLLPGSFSTLEEYQTRV